MSARVTWLGHATVLVDAADTAVVTDPVLRRRVAHLRRDNPVPAERLRGLDAVLLSHLHLDHLDLPSLRSLGRALPIVVPRGGRGMLRRRGFRAVTEVEPGDELDVGGLHVSVTYADHDGRRMGFGRRVPALGFVVEAGPRLYFAGDTDLFEGMAELGPLDAALVPIWGWGPRVGQGHLDPARAAEALTLLRPRVAVPIHWGTYRVRGSRPTSRDPLHAFLDAAASSAPDVEVRVLGEGETLELNSPLPRAPRGAVRRPS